MPIENGKQVEVIDKETPFKGYFQINRYTLRHEQFGGGMGPEITREIFERGHAASVVPYDPIRDQIVMIEQFRPGAYAAGSSNPWMIEVVAGIIEAGETAEDVCRREVVEEAGIEIRSLHHLATHYMTPGGSTESMAMHVGSCDSEGVGGIHGLADEGEDIRVFVLPRKEALDLVHRNEIQNAMTALNLLLFEQMRPSLHFD